MYTYDIIILEGIPTYIIFRYSFLAACLTVCPHTQLLQYDLHARFFSLNVSVSTAGQ